MKKIRNFSIIAHIDHGKSTLADRLIQYTGVVEARMFKNQILDTMDLERERGITIKSQTIRLPYKAKDGHEYELNLIDTPGHVDFTYEVSRALASCDGVLLLIDASQGVEAQTLANLYLAMEHDFTIIPIINKIDLPSADIDRVLEQIDSELGLDPDEAIQCSAKEGIGIEEILEAIITRLPPPTGDINNPLSALIFDAQYDSFRGTVIFCRIFEGQVKAGDSIQLMSINTIHTVEEVGYFCLKRQKCSVLQAGEVGYIMAGVKTVSDARIGDTITFAKRPTDKPLPGFREAKPVVFSSIYPVSSDNYEDLTEALEKYKLNDAALIFEKDTSAALGMGFRCGFLGLLHLEIVQERLEREYDLSLIMTTPTVRYTITLNNGEQITIDNPALYPDPTTIEKIEEPYIKATIIIPDRYMGAVMKLCLERRGLNTGYHYIGTGRLEMVFELPLAEVIYDFYDNLKSITQGYGSFDYEILDYRQSPIVKVDILINGEKVDALAQLVHQDRARARALHVCDRLREEIPRQMFKVAIQGTIGAKIIARSTISPFRKDVLAKCYGGDITRKRKLLEKQKKGKKRMKMVGSVGIPQKAFLAVLKTKTD